MAPLAPTRYKVQFTIDEATRQTLRLAQDLLRRKIPDGDLGALFARALTALLDEVARETLGAATRPGPRRASAPRSRHVPAAVTRGVWLRDGGQCAFVSKGGRRCTERAYLEFHHVDAYALGGEASVDNISLRCRRHNVHESELVFGPYPSSPENQLVPEQVGSVDRLTVRASAE